MNFNFSLGGKEGGVKGEGGRGREGERGKGEGGGGRQKGRGEGGEACTLAKTPLVSLSEFPGSVLCKSHMLQTPSVNSTECKIAEIHSIQVLTHLVPKV